MPCPSQAQTLQGGGGRRSLRGQDQPHPQVRGQPPPPSTAVRPAWEAQSQITAETMWLLGGDAGNQGDGRRAASVASPEPGNGQAVSTAPPAGGHRASPCPDPHLWPLAAAASAHGALAGGSIRLWPVPMARFHGHCHLASPRGRTSCGLQPHTWPLTASRVPQVLQECLRP